LVHGLSLADPAMPRCFRCKSRVKSVYLYFLSISSVASAMSSGPAR
jgi:hypothetical protein